MIEVKNGCENKNVANKNVEWKKKKKSINIMSQKRNNKCTHEKQTNRYEKKLNGPCAPIKLSCYFFRVLFLFFFYLYYFFNDLNKNKKN